MSYDQKCYDLAADFLHDEPHLNTEQRRDELAQTIQTTIEMMISYEKAVVEILRTALDEDDREHSHFDRTGFFQFCPEDSPRTVEDAWVIYNRIVYGGEDRIAWVLP